MTHAPFCYAVGSAIEANDAAKDGDFLIQAVDANDMVKRAGLDVLKVISKKKSERTAYRLPATVIDTKTLLRYYQ